jgi:CHAP domain
VLNNKWYIFTSILLVVFFGYLTYKEFFSAAASQASSTIESDIKVLEKSMEGIQSSEYFGNLRAKIALEEYNKNVAEDTRGCNCGIIIDQYTQGNHNQWCTMFASWVTMHAGSPLKANGKNGWRIDNSRVLTEYLKTKGTFYTRDEITKKNINPQVGDFVIFFRGNYEESLGHTDIVVALTGKSGSADLIGGNVNDRVEYRSNFQYLDYYGFIGFGRPEQ